MMLSNILEGLNNVCRALGVKHISKIRIQKLIQDKGDIPYISDLIKPGTIWDKKGKK